jgi:hypothetical protein
MMHENAERAGLIMKGLGRKAKATADGSHGYNKAIKNTRRSFDSVALVMRDLAQDNKPMVELRFGELWDDRSDGADGNGLSDMWRNRLA